MGDFVDDAKDPADFGSHLEYLKAANIITKAGKTASKRLVLLIGSHPSTPSVPITIGCAVLPGGQVCASKLLP